MIMTGSDLSPPTGALFFEEDGTVQLHLAVNISDDDRASITLASDFFQYAIQQEDWTSFFLESVYCDLEEQMTPLKKRALTKNDLRVIKGGLISNVSGTKCDTPF